METFLEVILWKSFQLFRLILNDDSSIKKVPSFNDDFIRGNS